MEEVSSRLAACSEAPSAMAWLEAETCCAAEFTCAEAEETPRITSPSRFSGPRIITKPSSRAASPRPSAQGRMFSTAWVASCRTGSRLEVTTNAPLRSPSPRSSIS